MHGRPNIVCRHIVCQHRVEVEVSPATAEVCFQDERFAHPFNTMVQFQAYVYNAPSNRVTWQVLNPQGGPGAGTIDAGGLYVAPLKGAHPYSLTDLVVATSVDDPFRRALAHVAIVGLGPEPKPVPEIQVFPHRVYLYRPQGARNSYIDLSNTMQLFRVLARHSDPTQVQWNVDGGATVATGTEFLFQLSGTGGVQQIRINAVIPGIPLVADWARVTVLNYDWPGIT
jgi:hypothetical protein